MFEILPNFTRVTPAQLPHISFPTDGRYQPVRAVSAKIITGKSGKVRTTSANTAEKYAGGGGILILADLRPDEEGEFIETVTEPIVEAPEPTAPTSSNPNGHAVGAVPSGPHIALNEDAPEADPPESFEVSPSSVTLFALIDG